MTLLEAEPLAVSVGIAAMKKKGENVSGDRGTYFKTDAGVLCVILSDGMGSGEDAAVESREAVEILERFLRSGVDPATAMKILNSVMLLRHGDEWGYATVDLMCVDLFTGGTCFYKYGAAPSYEMCIRDRTGTRPGANSGSFPCPGTPSPPSSTSSAPGSSSTSGRPTATSTTAPSRGICSFPCPTARPVSYTHLMPASPSASGAIETPPAPIRCPRLPGFRYCSKSAIYAPSPRKI